jgi:hypothetical protein
MNPLEEEKYVEIRKIAQKRMNGEIGAYRNLLNSTIHCSSTTIDSNG